VLELIQKGRPVHPILCRSCLCMVRGMARGAGTNTFSTSSPSGVLLLCAESAWTRRKHRPGAAAPGRNSGLCTRYRTEGG